MSKPKPKKIIRTDRWQVSATEEQNRWAAETLAIYRRYVRALIGVVWTHWPVIATAKSPLQAIEHLIHPTNKRPSVRYTFFRCHFYKFPSYLRRAAIEAAVGQVSSFAERYATWQSGIRSRRDALPPLRTGVNELHPPLYRGNMIKFHENFSVAELKLWNGKDWIWTKVPIRGKRSRHLLADKRPGGLTDNLPLSPTLLLRRGRLCLGIPFEIPKFCQLGDRGAVCAIDLGINSTATASIVRSDGTVLARRFFHRGSDIDHRDKLLVRIRDKARKTAKLSKGFCSGLYRKARHLNREMAQNVARDLYAFARSHGVTIFVFEYLKGFRPKRGRKRTTLRQRFHGWLHRLLVRLLQERAEEHGCLVRFVPPHQSSEYAFDGSGKVKRDKDNATLVTFPSGKHYNADLNASYNIAARYWAARLGHKDADANRRSGNDPEATPGQCPRRAPRIPVTLSSLWTVAAELEAATTAATAA